MSSEASCARVERAHRIGAGDNDGRPVAREIGRQSARPASAAPPAPRSPRAQRRGGAFAVRQRAGDEDAHQSKKPGPARLRSSRAASAPSAAASARRPVAADIVRRAAVRPRDQAAEMQCVAFDRGVGADRRPAGAVEHREERALASQRDRRIGVIDLREQRRASSLSSSRVSIAMAPCPAAGRNSSALMIVVARASRPSRFKPGERKDDGVGLAVIELAQPRLDIAAQRRDSRSGRMRFMIACRRSDAVPTFAPRGRSAMLFALRLMNTSRGSSRSRQAAMHKAGRQRRSACPWPNARRDRCRRAAAPPRSPW